MTSHSKSRSKFLKTKLRQESPAADLKALDARIRASAPSTYWTFYYADWLLANRTA